MKRKIALIGAAVLYIAVLAGLLWIQYQTISGARSRGAANGAALVLAVPSAAVFILLIRAGSPAGERRARKEVCGENARQQDTCKKSDGAGEEAISGQDELRLQELLRGRYMLTARECAVSWLILRGYTNRQIAEELFISELTVKKHASHIYEKTGAFGRKEYTELIKRIRKEQTL